MKRKADTYLVTAENGGHYNHTEGANDEKELIHFANPLCVQDSETPESYPGCSRKRKKKRKMKDLRSWLEGI